MRPTLGHCSAVGQKYLGSIPAFTDIRITDLGGQGMDTEKFLPKARATKPYMARQSIGLVQKPASVQVHDW